MNRRSKSFLSALGLICFLCAPAAAAEPSPIATAKPARTKGAVLDFEADVIEGEKRKPDIFMQMEGGAGSIDSVLYSREDFNDYHELDRKWRPKMRRLKVGGAKKP